MASRRVSASTVDWAAFARKIPAAQKGSFTALKQKSDGFMRAVNALPAAAPKIDFETYKSKVAVAGMVDDFQKKYEALDIPYPADKVSASVSITSPALLSIIHCNAQHGRKGGVKGNPVIEAVTGKTRNMSLQDNHTFITGFLCTPPVLPIFCGSYVRVARDSR